MKIRVQFLLDDRFFLKNPEQSKLGKKIISYSVELIDELGFEDFTFKKLADEINSTEASVYRYFENKHRLLLYLVSWYWAWIEFQIDYRTNNLDDPLQKIDIVIETIAKSNIADPHISHINENKLHNIVVAEAAKSYLTKKVDDENKEGLFLNYKSLCDTISEIIRQVNPDYPYPNSLASNLIETAHEQQFFADHIPSLTDIKAEPDRLENSLIGFLKHLMYSMLDIKSGQIPQ